MAVTAKLYTKVFLSAFNEEIDFAADNIKCMLLQASGLTIDQHGDQYLGDVSYTECPATGNYSTGGALLDPCTIDNTGGVVTFTAPDVDWENSTISARYALIYDDTPATNKPVIAYVDFGETYITTAGTFTIDWNASGLATITVT